MSVKHICVFAFFATVLLSSASYGDINVLTNPGFETGNTNGWSTFYNFGSIGVVSSPVRSGSYAGRVYNRDEWWYGPTQNLLGKMMVGETYKISTWVRTNSPASSDLNMFIVKTDFDGTNFEWIDSATINNSDWVELSGNFSLTDVNGVLAELFIFFYGLDPGIDIYIDDANAYGPEVPPLAGEINVNVRHQILDGFGAAGAWYENWLIDHPLRETLYDILFDELGLDIYRLRNTYAQASGGGSDYMYRSGRIIAEAKERNPNLKILISSWSPPAPLKSNNSLVSGTLAKDDMGYYRYDLFADWWADSITAWSDYGVDADYIGMQNEPDYEATWDSCRFDPTENSIVAGHNEAFEAVYSEMYSRFGSSMPKMLGPEATGFYGASGYSLDDYLTAITNPSHYYGYAHHLYNLNAGDNPDAYISAMQNLNSSWGSKPLFQTEYEKSSDPAVWPDALNMALLLHNSLTVEEVSGYFYWSLFWREPSGLVSFPSHGSPEYTINSDFYGFKHYSAFIHSGWQRVETSTNYSSGLKLSAYISPDNNELSVVIINTNSGIDVDVNLSFPGFAIADAIVYRTSETENCVAVSGFNPVQPLTFPAQSINTIAISSDPTILPPSPPMNLSSKVTKNRVSLDWDDNPEADVNGYNIYRSETSGSGYSKVNSSLVSDSNYIDETIVTDKTYYYVVTAVDTSNNEGPYSQEEVVTASDGSFERFYFCGFENGEFEDGWEGWINLTSDDVDWTRHYNETPTGPTGPDSGANDSTWYVYLETSSGHANDPGDTAILEGPEIEDHDNRVLNFYYHMYGATMGTLYVDVYDGSWHNGVWSLSGQQQTSVSDPYSKATVYLNNYTGPIKIRFRAVAAGGATGDMAIDDIEVVSGRHYGDFTADTIVDHNDLNVLGAGWLMENCNDPDGIDFDKDCIINFYEFSMMAENWLK